MIKLQKRKTPKAQYGLKLPEFSYYNYPSIYSYNTNYKFPRLPKFNVELPKLSYRPVDREITPFVKDSDYPQTPKFDVSELFEGAESIDKLKKSGIDPFTHSVSTEPEIEKLIKKKTIENDTIEEGDKKNLLDDLFKVIKDREVNPASWVKPALGATAILAGYKNLQRTRDAAKNIKAPRVDAPTITNRPIQGLSPELINLYLKNIGSLSAKKTSDSTANILANQMLNLRKMEAMDKLSTKQTENLQRERARFDKVTAANQLTAVKARNEQSKYAADLYNKKAAIEAGYLKAKGDWTTRTVDELIKNVDRRIRYNTGVAVQNKQSKINLLQDLITNTTNQLRLNPANTNLIKKLKGYRADQEGLLKNIDVDYYGKVSSSWIKPKE